MQNKIFFAKSFGLVLDKNPSLLSMIYSERPLIFEHIVGTSN